MSGKPAGWKIEELRSVHDRAGFYCGHESLDRFIKELASQHQRANFSRTFVALRPGDPVVCGYYTLASGAVRMECLGEAQKKRLPRHPVPIALLGRLGVRRDAQGFGLGEHLLIDALRRVVQTSEQLGIHAVEVDAIDESAKKFYLKYGFTELIDNPQHLYMPLKTIRHLGLA